MRRPRFQPGMLTLILLVLVIITTGVRFWMDDRDRRNGANLPPAEGPVQPT